MPDEVDWNARYEEGDVPWDKGAPAPPLVDWVAANPLQGRVLVPGAGTGHDAALIAERCPGAAVLGLDLAPRAVDAARHRYSAPNLRFELGDLFDPAWLAGSGATAFDWVVEHTCFCAIDPGRRGEYVDSVARALAHRGRLWAVFYLDPYDDEHPRGAGPPHGVGVAELDALFDPRFEKLEEFVPDRAYPGREGLELVRVYAKR